MAEWIIRILSTTTALLFGFMISQLTIVGKIREHSVLIDNLKEEIRNLIPIIVELVKQNTVLIAELRARNKR